MRNSILSGLSRLRRERPHTFRHSKSVSNLANSIYIQLRANSRESSHLHSLLNGINSRDIKLGGLYHDIGKLCIDRDLLRQKSYLTEEQREVIETHPDNGYALAEKIVGEFDAVLNCVHYHHESMDGKGYPHSLLGNQIPFEARIIMVADHFDAMTNRESFNRNGTKKRSKTIDEALTELEHSNHLYDPHVLNALFEIKGKDLSKKITQVQPSHLYFI